MKCWNADCNYSLDSRAIACPECGAERPKSTGEAPRDQNWWRCCDTDRNGNRCSKPGSLSESVKGSDRWWCHTHFPMFRSRNTGNSIPPPEWARKHQPAARPVAVIAEEMIERTALQSEGA